MAGSGRSIPLIRALAIAGMMTSGGDALGAPLQFAGAPCARPPELHCPDSGCAAQVVVNGGSVVEAKTGRTYFLDYPCDLKRGEKVTFILSLHGGGSYGNWQRHYFPILDYVDKYRLVIATPFSPRRVWTADDDGYLQNIVTSVIEQLGHANIKAFWLAGHSQGGLTSTRIVCSDFFKTKVDGFLSLSGGRVGGQAGRAANFGVPAARGATDAGRGAAPPAALPPGALVIPPPPACDFTSSKLASTRSARCQRRRSARNTDARPRGSARSRRRQSGLRLRRDATDPVRRRGGFCRGRGRQRSCHFAIARRRVVADVVRIDKGHTEGLEPKVTEELVKLMLSARGGKIQQGG